MPYDTGVLEFPTNARVLRLTREEWAAHLLLRDQSLLTAREPERASDFYNPRTRTLAPQDDPVFESKMEEAQREWEKSVGVLREMYQANKRWPTWEDEDIRKSFSAFDGKEEFDFSIANLRWRMEEGALLDLKADGVTEFDRQSEENVWHAATDEELEDQRWAIEAARLATEEAWMTWRDKLTLYIQRIRLASLIIARRNETKLSQEQFASYAQVSASTIKNFENVDEPDRWFSPKTIELMETALGWEAGSITAILRGGDPVLVPEWGPATAPPVEASGRVMGASTSSGSASGHVSVRLDPEAMEITRKLAFAEERTVNAVVADAVRFYAKYHLDEETS